MSRRGFTAAMAFAAFVSADALAAQHSNDSHAAPAAHPPAGKSDVSSGPAAATAASDHTKPTVPAKNAPVAKTRATAASRKGADNGLSTALSRIQERIATETGPHAKVAGSTAPGAARHDAQTRPQRPARLVTLRWRLELDWPAELAEEEHPAPPARVQLKW